MLSLPATVRIYAATAPCDMRKQIDGLAALVEQQLGHNARSGDLFVAFNRRGDMARILFWDISGFCLVTKRLEVGVFGLPWKRGEVVAELELDAEQLGRILEGVVTRPSRRRARRTPSEEMHDATVN
jgi:transposase